MRFALPVLLLLSLSEAYAQIQTGTVKGTIVDANGAVLPGIRVVLGNPLTGYGKEATTKEHGEFIFHNVPFDTHRLRVEPPGFQPWEKIVKVDSNLPVTLQIELSLAALQETATVKADPFSEKDSISTETVIDANFIQRSASGGSVQQTLATVPGWSAEDNGLLHSRGVDDGFLFVIDGIPLRDRIDALFGASMDPDTIQSMQVITGHIPAEYGYASGGIVHILPKSGIDSPWNGSFGLGAGNLETGELGGTLSGNIKRKVGFFILSSIDGSLERYLDPVDPRNFNNRGGVFRFHTRLDWHPTSSDIFLVNLSFNGSDFRVTNNFEQEEAGQRQRQQLRDNGQSIAWQHIWSADTVTNSGWYRQFHQAELIPSSNDFPLSVRAFRHHERQGIFFHLTHFVKGHTIKVGAEGQRVSPSETFSFFVTDPEGAMEADLSEPVLQFDPDNPFVFRDRAVRGQASCYIQDTFPLFQNLTINAGLRFDYTSVLVRDSQFSPRIGAAYYFPQTRTTIRGSYNRLFMPPQVENLLLSSSEQARRLSPFATPEGKGGAEVPPEKQHAFEFGFVQPVGNAFKIDLAYWWRFVHNYDDPNVFLGTTIIFPNSVFEGQAQGIDARIDFPERRGWSAFLSYSNSSVFQVGPINGGLFLEEEVIEIGPGTKFTPDHDQRNVGALGVMYYDHKTGFWASFGGRHESGTPLEVEEEEEIEELMERPGADLVNFERGRVKPRTLFDVSVGIDLFRNHEVSLKIQFNVQNLTNRSFAYNFGNPFSGTHFGHPRLLTWQMSLLFGNNPR